MLRSITIRVSHPRFVMIWWSFCSRNCSFTCGRVSLFGSSCSYGHQVRTNHRTPPQASVLFISSSAQFPHPMHRKLPHIFKLLSTLVVWSSGGLEVCARFSASVTASSISFSETDDIRIFLGCVYPGMLKWELAFYKKARKKEKFSQNNKHSLITRGSILRLDRGSLHSTDSRSARVLRSSRTSGCDRSSWKTWDRLRLTVFVAVGVLIILRRIQDAFKRFVWSRG